MGHRARRPLSTLYEEGGYGDIGTQAISATAGTTETVEPRAFRVDDSEDEPYGAEEYATTLRNADVFNAGLKAEIAAAKELTVKAKDARIQNAQAQLARARSARASARDAGAAASNEDRNFSGNTRTVQGQSAKGSIAYRSDNLPHTLLPLGSRYNPIELSPEPTQYNTLDETLGAGQNVNAGWDFDIYEDHAGDDIMPSIEDGFDREGFGSPDSEASTFVPAGEDLSQRTRGRFASGYRSASGLSVTDDAEQDREDAGWDFDIYEDPVSESPATAIIRLPRGDDPDLPVTPSPLPARADQDDPEGLLSSDNSSGSERSISEDLGPHHDDARGDVEIYEDSDEDATVASAPNSFVQGWDVLQREDPFQTENLLQTEDLSEMEDTESHPTTATSPAASIEDAAQDTAGALVDDDTPPTDLSLLDDLERVLDGDYRAAMTNASPAPAIHIQASRTQGYSHPYQNFFGPARSPEYPTATSTQSTAENPAAADAPHGASHRGGWLVDLDNLFSDNAGRTYNDFSPPASPRQNPVAIQHTGEASGLEADETRQCRDFFYEYYLNGTWGSRSRSG